MIVYGEPVFFVRAPSAPAKNSPGRGKGGSQGRGKGGGRGVGNGRGAALGQTEEAVVIAQPSLDTSSGYGETYGTAYGE